MVNLRRQTQYEYLSLFFIYIGQGGAEGAGYW